MPQGHLHTTIIFWEILKFVPDCEQHANISGGKYVDSTRLITAQ